MRLKLKDLFATVLMAAIAVPYIGYLVRGEMPPIEDAHGMAGTGLVFGAVAFFVLWRGDPFDRTGKAETAWPSSAWGSASPPTSSRRPGSPMCSWPCSWSRWRWSGWSSCSTTPASCTGTDPRKPPARTPAGHHIRTGIG